MKNDNLVSVDGHGDLVRDPQSGAILNINTSDIQQAREAKKLRTQKLKEEQELKATVDKLENDVGEIKDLLSQLVGKING